MIGIIDYGAGNLLSVKKAFDFLNVKNIVIRSSEEFRGIEKVVLPGVGAFGAAVDTLRSQGLYKPIEEWLLADKPFLGICLGLQMLFEVSEEFGSSQGFGIFQGRVPQFTQGKVPQIGWNQVEYVQQCPLWNGIADHAFFYFLHGYYVAPKDDKVVVGKTDYGITYTSAIARGNIYAVQFHPEKSGKLGVQLLQNWVKIC